MRRRTYLSASLTAGIAALAGCSDQSNASTDSPTASATPPPTDSATPTTSSTDDTGTPTGTSAGEVVGSVTEVAGVSLPVPKELFARGAPKNAIPAITEPEFDADWSGISMRVRGPFGEKREIEPRLTPEDRVIGVVRDGEARAYPLRILNWHEIVNDDFGGPLLVTFCPLCGSGMTAERRVEGTETQFGVSGYLWNSDLVMFDEKTESLWSQIAATAVRGPRTGVRLPLVPSQITTLGSWRTSHPDTEVLLPPPKSNTVVGRDALRDYTANPYAGYADSRQVGIGNNEDAGDDRLHPKAEVLGIATDDAAVAYPLETVKEAGGVVNDTVGDVPVVVALGADGESLFGYERTVDGETLTFESADASRLKAGGSRWEVSTGDAVDGPFEGTTLSDADGSQMFWFAWLDFNGDTEVFGKSDGG